MSFLCKLVLLFIIMNWSYRKKPCSTVRTVYVYIIDCCVYPKVISTDLHLLFLSCFLGNIFLLYKLCIRIDCCVSVLSLSLLLFLPVCIPALAIGLHNFPEGMATFVAALSSPSLGAALAIAIALHNIPEGFCVAMPIYYATGSRWKGFLWAFLSGVSEPIGMNILCMHSHDRISTPPL